MVDIKISKTGEGELLIHKSDGKRGWINAIIDEDGDIELMHITHNHKIPYHKMGASVDETIKFINQ